MANEKIIDVDLEAHDTDLHAAMRRFQQDINRIQTVVGSIGTQINNSFALLDNKTKDTVRNLQRAQSLTAAIDKLANGNNLSPAKEGQLRRQMASEQIRSLRDVESLNRALHETQSRRAIALQRISEETNKKTREGLIAEMALQDQIEAKIKRRTREIESPTGSSGRMSPAEELRRDRTLAEQQIRNINDVAKLREVVNASRIRQETLANRLATQSNAIIVKGLQDQIVLQRTLEIEGQKRIKQLESGGGGGIFPSGGVGGVLARTAMYAGAGTAIYGVASAAQQAVAFTIQLEDKLATLQAISGSTADQMDTLAVSILEVASNAKFSTLELVEATTVLAQAGMTTQEMARGLAAVSNLAVATGTSVATSAETLTSTIGAFQLQASEMPRISDALVSGLNRSKLSIDQVSSALQYAGATAFENNITFEELVGTAGALAQAGIRSGSTIGTGLRQFLVDLQAPSEKLVTQLTALKLTVADVDVGTRGLVPVLTTLRDAGFDSAQAYGALETRAAAAYLVAKNNIPVIQELVDAQYAVGTAARAAEVSMDSLGAQWQRFLNITGAGTAEMLAEPLTRLKNILKAVNDQMVENTETSAMFSANLSAQFPMLTGLGDALDFLTLGFRDTTTETERLATELNNSTDAFNTSRQKVEAVDDAISNLLAQEERYQDNSPELQTQVLALSQRFEGLGVDLLSVAGNYDTLIRKMQEYRAEAELTTAARAAELSARASEQFTASSRAANNLVSGGFGRRLTGASRQAYDQLQTTLNPRTEAQRSQHQLALNSFIGTTSQIQNPEDRRDAQRYGTYIATRATADLDYRSGRRESAAALFRGSARGREAVGNLDRIRQWSGAPGESREAFGNITFDQHTTGQIASWQAQMEQATTQVQKDFYSGLIAQAQSFQIQGQTQEGESAAARRERQAAERLAAREGRSAASAAARASRLNDRNELTVANEGLAASKLELEEVLELLKDPLDLGDFSTLTEELYDSFNEWTAARATSMEAEIKKANMSAVQEETFRKEVTREIDVRRRELSQALTQSIVGMYDNLIEQAQEDYERAIQPFEAGVQLAQARISSYDRTYNQGNVPDYVRSEQEFQGQQVSEEFDRQRLIALRAQIAAREEAAIAFQRAIDMVSQGATAAGDGTTAELDVNLAGVDVGSPDQIIAVAHRLGELGTTAGITARDMQNLQEKSQEMSDALRVSKDEAAALSTSLQAVPIPDFATGLQMAAQNYARVNNLNRTFEEDITMGLGGAFSETHGIMNSFFNDLITKPMSAAQAFQSMGQSIIAMMARMAAEAAAKQIMSILLSFIPGAAGAGGGASVAGPAMNSFAGGISYIPGRYGGGEVGNDNGGLINKGISSRDSVLTGVARGEFITQKTAVDSVGVDFMRAVNSRGAEALRGMGGNSTFVTQAPARQDMSVYIVAPEEKPQLGANDVIAIIDRNIMKDGSTKRLIRHVSQGG
jgi:TP901 family phage tail tape measure protein